MAVAFDAATELGTATTGALSGTHTPSGTPKGAIVKITHGTEANDLITGVTYGGVAMERIGDSRDTATEPGRAYIYGLGEGVPSGAQTVTVSHTGNSTVKHAVVETYTAATDDTEFGSGFAMEENSNNLTWTPAKAVAGMLTSNVYSGMDTPVTNLALGSGLTAVHDHDFGAFFSQQDRETSPSGPGSAPFTWTYTPTASDDLGWAVVNVQEKGSGVRPIGIMAPQATNTTTSTSLIMTGSLAGKRLIAVGVSRDSTSASADVTLTDDSGGNTWTRINTDADKKAWVWEKVGVAGDVGATVTMASAVGSCQLIILVMDGHGGAATNVTNETNASGNESHTTSTPDEANSYFLFFILDDGNDTNAATAISGATIGSLDILAERLSTGGSDCRITVAGKLNSGSSATGTISWTQTDSTTKTCGLFIPPDAAVTAVTSVDSDYGTGSEEFDTDENALTVNGGGFDTCDVYLSADATLAGGTTEIDISAAITAQDSDSISLDLTDLTTELADIEALLVAEGHSLFLIVDGVNGEDSIAVTVHRAKAWALAASANIAASGENTTAQLTPPTGKSTSDFGGGRIQDDENPGDTVDIGIADYREDEWSIEATTQAFDGETYDFRVLRNGVVLNTYTVTPQATIGGDNPIDFNVEEATEIDEAFDVLLQPEPVFAVEEATEIDEAAEVTLAVDLTFAVEEAVEVDEAFDVEMSVEVGINLEEAVEIDEAFDVELTVNPLFAVEEAVEVDEAFDVSLTVEPLFEVEEATEIDEAFEINLATEIIFDNEKATEVDEAFDVSLTLDLVFSVEEAVEVDEAIEVFTEPEPVFEVELAVEVDEAFDAEFTLVGGFAVELATEIDEAFEVSLAPEPLFTVEEAVEVDSAEEITLEPDLLYTVESATEADSAFDVEMSVDLVFEVELAVEVDVAAEAEFDVLVEFVVEEATEVDEAFEINLATDLAFTVEEATEVDEALEVLFQPNLVFSVELATEIDEAFDVEMEVDAAGNPNFDVELAEEIDRAFDAIFSLDLVFAVELATEIDRAFDIDWSEEEQIDVLLGSRNYRDRDRTFSDGSRTYQTTDRSFG